MIFFYKTRKRIHACLDFPRLPAALPSLEAAGWRREADREENRATPGLEAVRVFVFTRFPAFGWTFFVARGGEGGQSRGPCVGPSRIKSRGCLAGEFCPHANSQTTINEQRRYRT